MNELFYHLKDEGISYFFDDVLLFSEDIEAHKTLLLKVFDILQKNGITVSKRKCSFFKSHIKYLGHIVGDGELRIDPSRIEAIKQLPVPRNRKSLLSLLGFLTWHLKHIPDFQEILKPLNDLRSPKVPYKWTEAQDLALNRIKELFETHIVLKLPDLSSPFIVQSDCSSRCLSGVVLQEDANGFRKPVAYYSKLLKPSDKNKSVYLLED